MIGTAGTTQPTCKVVSAGRPTRPIAPQGSVLGGLRNILIMRKPLDPPWAFPAGRLEISTGVPQTSTVAWRHLGTASTVSFPVWARTLGGR